MTPTQSMHLVYRSLGVKSGRGLPILVPIHGGLTNRGSDVWVHAIRETGATPVVVIRAVAAARAAGISLADQSRLFVELGDAFISATVLVDGTPAHSTLLRFEEAGWRTAAESLVKLVSSLDPDQEIEIRDVGMHVYGMGVGDAGQFAELTGIRLSGPTGGRFASVIGAQRIAGDMNLWAPAL